VQCFSSWSRTPRQRVLALTLLAAAAPVVLAAQRTEPRPADWVPPLASLMAPGGSELRNVVERFTLDRSALIRRFDVANGRRRRAALDGYYSVWDGRLREADFARLGLQGRADWILLKNRIARERALLALEAKRTAEMSPLLPFAAAVRDLQERRRQLDIPVPDSAGRALAKVVSDIADAKKAVEDGKLTATRIVAHRAANEAIALRELLRRWYEYHAGYDPLFTWWAKSPHEKAAEAMQGYARTLREKLGGWKQGEEEPIVGDPIGREALLADLRFEMIPYTPEELVKIAEREFAWCEAEMKKASRAMGFGDDWKAALEKVKTLHAEPGKQTQVVRDLAFEAIEFVEKRNLVTVPPLAKEIWRMEMLSPDQQRVSPFFLGGEVIRVSFPTDAMLQDEKLMSMRGNNVHFSRATVQHELIPGHHLTGFMSDRVNPHRDAFGTPFWTEGWALYWEMLLWDLDFPRSPEDRVGMLFWRSHRAARIIFSLSFHLGAMTPQQAIDLLVDRVGHERANATAEVRRSFNGSYSPLYQVAYMMGGLQFRALHQELVKSGRMTDRAFHDAVLATNSMPVEMVRAVLTNQRLGQDHAPSWRFAGELP
jgi:uncharacterized protein (DUF885 family)